MHHDVVAHASPVRHTRLVVGEQPHERALAKLHAARSRALPSRTASRRSPGNSGNGKHQLVAHHLPPLHHRHGHHASNQADPARHSLSQNTAGRALWADTQEGVTIYCHIHPIAPFSWMRSIVISEDDYTNNASTILRHEMGHIQNHHSLDIVLLNACQIIQWANPLVWVMAHSLRDVHEYEADDAVLRSGVSIHQYHNLLIKKAVGSSSYAFANSFNHSLLKKRITVMLKKKSNPWMRSKALYILPVAVVALSAFATPEFNNHANAGIEVINSGKVTEKSATSQDLKNFSASTAPDEEDTIFMICEEMPEFEGGAAKMMEMLRENVKYPAIAQEHGVQGQIIVGFIVEKDGSCSNFEIKRNSAAEKTEGTAVNAYARPDSIAANAANIQKAKKALEEEAIRVCKLMKFKPGKQRGQAVRVRFTVPLTFRLQ